MMYQVIYRPKVQDEVVVAQFETRAEADEYMEKIKEQKPKAYPHHYIKDVVQMTTYVYSLHASPFRTIGSPLTL